MAPDLLAGRGAGGAQDERDGPAGSVLVDMDRRVAALPVEPVPEGELLLAMDGVERVINIEGRPKGVVYSHRGAWTNAVNNVVTWEMPHHPVYLWTLPLFHCNGRCFPWTITMLAGTHVFLRAPRADPIYDAFAYHGVTHLCGAPIIMSMISGAETKRDFPQKIRMMTAAAPPPASVIKGMEAMGISVTHVYGLNGDGSAR